MSGPATGAAASKVTNAAANKATSKWQAFVNHPAGPKTIFFWAPLAKWALVAAGIKDLQRPADKLSVSQNVALAATGFIWVRYSLVITPVNYSLAAVNFFVGTTGLTQLYRIWDWRRKNPEAYAAEEKAKAAKAAAAKLSPA
ncbi:Mitochondrial pyruvate carrier 2 [Vanrija pseudolonga]|uniref:Mitochondrial pyruvate carrier n=1 Tax=Vanrija pseudolonga TaxID=143232 RepID=A0AAF1BLG5_9TREE|nr:Mitochondrial pyruvate carrier 2 [Vanrija pseudolonga]